MAGGTLGAPRGAALTAGPMRAPVAILAAILLPATARRPGTFARVADHLPKPRSEAP